MLNCPHHIQWVTEVPGGLHQCILCTQVVTKKDVSPKAEDLPAEFWRRWDAWEATRPQPEPVPATAPAAAPVAAPAPVEPTAPAPARQAEPPRAEPREPRAPAVPRAPWTPADPTQHA